MTHVVIIDPEGGSCQGTCGRLATLARAAFPPGSLEVTTLGALPPPGRREPDLVILRACSERTLAGALSPLREAWGTAAVLGALCGGYAGLRALVDSLSGGLDDFLCCPFGELDLAARLRRLLPDAGPPRPERPPLPRGARPDVLVGESPSFVAAVARVPKVASSDATVLIGGETGVGKGLFARAIHYGGARRGRPFVPVNCGALPDQLFENELFGHVRGAYTDASSAERGLLAEAEGGTLFLDEVDTLGHAAQAKLLRFLQDREYRPLGSSKTLTADVRVVAATNAALPELVAARQFRQDLFHRLNVLCITVPPLRERASDIPLLARHFLARHATQHGSPAIAISPAALRKMAAYPWPGNVRELEGLLHRAVVFGASDTVDADDVELPGEAAPPPRRDSLRGVQDEALHAHLTRLLAEHGGNVSAAAAAAGTDRRTFQRQLRRHGIARQAFLDRR